MGGKTDRLLVRRLAASSLYSYNSRCHVQVDDVSPYPDLLGRDTEKLKFWISSREILNMIIYIDALDV